MFRSAAELLLVGTRGRPKVLDCGPRPSPLVMRLALLFSVLFLAIGGVR